MKLFKITRNGSLYFELADGRVGITYTNGYVRVSTKSPNQFNNKTKTSKDKMEKHYNS